MNPQRFWTRPTLENCLAGKLPSQQGREEKRLGTAKKLCALCNIFAHCAFDIAHHAEGTPCSIAETEPIACAGPFLATGMDAIGKALVQTRPPPVQTRWYRKGCAAATGKIRYRARLGQLVPVACVTGVPVHCANALPYINSDTRAASILMSFA